MKVYWTSTLINGTARDRNLDMIQALGWNSLERTASGWAALFGKVDGRFKFLGAKTHEGSAVSLIEAVWEGDGEL